MRSELLNIEEPRQWTDNQRLSWYSHGNPAQQSEDDYQHLNHNGVNRPRKVTFVDSSANYFPPEEEERTPFQEKFENLKKMVGRIKDWISESISEMNIRQTYQGSSLRNFVERVKDRFSINRHESEDNFPSLNLQNSESSQNASSSSDSVVLSAADQNKAPKKEKFFLLNSPNNNNTTMNSSKNIGDHRETLDQQILAEWFIKCVNSNPTESSIRKTSQSRASLERQVSLMLASCFDKFGNLNRQSETSSADIQHENTDNNNKRNCNDDNYSNNNNSSGDENKLNILLTPDTKKLPLTCSSNNSETKDVSELVKMFDSHAFPSSSNEKIALKEKYSNVNVKNTIKQLDLILFRDKDKNDISRLYFGNILQSKPDISSIDSMPAPVTPTDVSRLELDKEESRKHVSRTDTLRDKFKKAFRFGNVSPTTRNRSYTLPPSRVLRFFTPARGQQVSITINGGKANKSKKIVNISRNNLDPLNKSCDEMKISEVFSRKDELPPRQSETKNRSKSIHPLIIPQRPHRRSRNKSCLNTENSFNFLFQKLFTDPPALPFKDEFGTFLEKENLCGESTWNRIYAWELRERLNDSSRQVIDSSINHIFPENQARKRFATRSSREDNRNSSSSKLNEVRLEDQSIWSSSEVLYHNFSLI